MDDDEFEPRGPAEQEQAPHLAAAKPPVTPPDFGPLVERWFGDHFPGSAVARHTEAWNVAHAAKEDLKRRLADL